MTAISSTHRFFKSTVRAMTAARQREASRMLNGFLLGLDDDRLKACGYRREDLKRSSNSLRM